MKTVTPVMRHPRENQLEASQPPHIAILASSSLQKGTGPVSIAIRAAGQQPIPPLKLFI